MAEAKTPIEVFCCYAHADESWLRKLETHLSLLQRQGLISLWHDRCITAGTDREKDVDMHLERASVILLLVSADFLASDYCYGVEMRRALERHAAGEARVVPIFVRSVDWTNAPFAHLQALPADAKPIASWRDKERALAAVAAGLRRVIVEELPQLSAGAPPHTALPAVWNIPYPRNPFFLGRDGELALLHSHLQAGRTTALSQPQALSGLGGIGKTQLALEYAYRYQRHYQVVLWTGAQTREALVSGYVSIAERLNLPEKDEQDQMAAIEAVLRWLKMHTQWLLILDNADDLSVVREFLPSVFGGHAIVTTRAQAMGRLANRVEVDALEQDVAALLLLRRASLIAPDAPLEQAQVADIATAMTICEELGGLPLALDQAGAYIEETQCSLSDYHRCYQTRRAALLQRRGGLVADHPEPVATTWSLAFEKIERKSPVAADLLRLCAFLHPDAIPEEIVTAGAPHLGSWLPPVASESFWLDEAARVLTAYSLLRRNGAEKTIRMHRLVQAVLKDAMDAQTRQQWARLAVLAVNEVFPDVKLTTWSLCERYLPHTQVSADLIKQTDMIFPEAAHLLHQAGRYLYTRGRYTEAEPFLRQALTVREHHLGLEHPGTARIVYHLAELQMRQKKYEQAEPLLVRALAIYEQSDPEHSFTASCLAGLGNLYRRQGKYEQAEPLLLRALALYEQKRGPEYPGVSRFLNDLAHLYEDQGKYELAESLLLRALAIDEQVVEPEHRSLATTLYNLAFFYSDQGKYEQAEPLYQRALTLYEQQSGPEDPGISDFLSSLAHLYQDQGKYEQAEPLFARALALRERWLGSEHPKTARSLKNLAHLYQDQGKYEQAEPLFARALAVSEQALGPHHRQTGTIRRQYASLLRAMGREAEAVQQET